MSENPAETALWALHAPLVHDANKQPEYRDNTETAIYGYAEGAEHALETVWAKGYRLPHIATTLADLDELEFESIIRDSDGLPKEKQSDGEGTTFWAAPGHDEQFTADDICLPAVVLYDPTEAVQ